MTNAELALRVDTSDEWIVARTGIRDRYIAGEGETTASLATDAARAALASAGVEPGEIDLIILATATPDQTFPASATIVQAALGINDCIAFDVAAVCSGFLYAVTVADNMLRGGAAKTALVIGAETMSRIPRLGGPRDLRPVRRRRRRRRAARAGVGPRRPGAAFSPAASTPTAATMSCSMSTAARRPPARSASCA